MNKLPEPSNGEFGAAIFGSSCALGIIACIIWIAFMLSGCTGTQKKGHGYDVHFFGINSADFEDRKVLPVIVGGLTSYATHEVGHYALGRAVGMDTSFKWDNGPAVWADEYDNKSKSDKFLFHAGGYITQFLIGTALTVVPYTRHSDFTVGFTGFTFVENTMYGITGGLMDSEYSDVKNLNHYGYPGNEIAIGAGLYSGVLTYINLNKHKDDQPIRRNCDLINIK